MSDPGHRQFRGIWRACVALVGVATTLGACAFCERPRPTPPPVQPIAFYPATAPDYYAAADYADYYGETVRQAKLVPAVERSQTSRHDVTAGNEKKPGTARDTMETCLKSWDERTHIPRAEWDEICARTLNDRSP